MIASACMSLAPDLRRNAPRAIVFDLDGTLCDSYQPITVALNAARAEFGLAPVSLAAVKRDVGRGLECLVEDHLGKQRVDAGVARFRATYAEVFQSGTIPLAGVPEVLQRLEECGTRMAVASNKPARFGQPIIELLGLADLIATVLGPTPEIPPKPHPAMLHAACTALGVAPEEALYVGDMPLDIASARAAGLPYLLVATGSASREELLAVGGDRVLDDLPALLTRIGQGDFLHPVG